MTTSTTHMDVSTWAWVWHFNDKAVNAWLTNFGTREGIPMWTFYYQEVSEAKGLDYPGAQSPKDKSEVVNGQS